MNASAHSAVIGNYVSMLQTLMRAGDGASRLDLDAELDSIIRLSEALQDRLKAIQSEMGAVPSEEPAEGQSRALLRQVWDLGLLDGADRSIRERAAKCLAINI